MSPLANLIALMFLLLIATAAVAWWTITAPERIVRAEREREARHARPPRKERVDLSNDTVRGARASRKNAPTEPSRPPTPGDGGVTVRPRKRSADDPFERFLDPENRRDDRRR